MWSARDVMMMVRDALHAALNARLSTAAQCDDIDVPRDDDDAWLSRPHPQPSRSVPHLTARTCRVGHCSDGGQFSAAREFPVRVSPQHRTDPRTRRHLTAVIRTAVTAGYLDRTPAYRCDAVHGT